MDWPAQSPDLNPIELWWDEVQRRLDKEGKPTSEDDLFNKIKHVWDNIPSDTLNKLIDRMPRVCKAVIAAKGGSFDEIADVKRFKEENH
jgi:transposase